MSIEIEQHLRLKNKICSDLNTKTFSIHRWERLNEIPQEIGLLQQLETLSVHKCVSIKIYPEELADLSHLRIVLVRFNRLKKIPPVFAQIKSLEELVLSNNSFLASTKWNLLAKNTTLRKLDVSYSLQNLKTLPKEIAAIKNLRELNISGNKFESLPIELLQLKKLEKLYCEVNDFEVFPVVLTQLPSLIELKIPASALKEMPNEILDLQYIPELKFSGKSNVKTPYIYTFERLLKNIKTYHFSRTFQRFFLSLIRGSIVIKDITNAELLSLLNSADSDYINQALAEIEKRIEANQFGVFRWPVAGDKIVIKGKIKGKVSELKQRLEQNEIQTGVKVNKATTHILVASMPKYIEEDPTVILITEQLLVAHLNKLEQPYLLISSEEDKLENIRQLLHSDQTENVLLGLEILKGGGFPMELLTELFLIYKFSRVQKVKRVINQIVGQYATLSFVTILKSRKSIDFSLSKVKRQKNLEFYCEGGNLDRRYIAFYLLEKGKQAHLFALYNLSTKDKQEYFTRTLKDGHLYLADLELTELPCDIAKIPGLIHLDISYNKFTEVPPGLLECKELKTLYIRGLYDIHQNPKDLWTIPSLETIHIGYNNNWADFKKFYSIELDGKKIIAR
jgi:Leucine-rich repeat (LRR) protein